MTQHHSDSTGRGCSRRTLLRGAGVLAAAASPVRRLLAETNDHWRTHVGLELYTVRDLMSKDFEGTIAKVAEIGYREVEPTSFGGLDPKQFRALLDRYKLTAPSTHTSATAGPGLEKELEGHQIMGFKYTEVRAPRPAPTPGGGPPRREPPTVESVKRSAAQHNEWGKAASKFGMKLLYHNHAFEFDPIEGSGKTQYDILLAETDPSLVAMQLDVAWACVGGQDPLAMFRQHPGRFELWHVKDVAGLKKMDMSTPPGRRRPTFIPIGQGDIDYLPIFAASAAAGLKYYVIEQDNAAENGADSMANAKANYQGLMKVLA